MKIPTFPVAVSVCFSGLSSAPGLGNRVWKITIIHIQTFTQRKCQFFQILVLDMYISGAKVLAENKFQLKGEQAKGVTRHSLYRFYVKTCYWRRQSEAEACSVYSSLVPSFLSNLRTAPLYSVGSLFNGGAVAVINELSVRRKSWREKEERDREALSGLSVRRRCTRPMVIHGWGVFG